MKTITSKGTSSGTSTGAPAPTTGQKPQRTLVALSVLALAVVAGIWFFGFRDSDIKPVAVEGTETCVLVGNVGNQTSHDCEDTMSDPRVAGASVVTARVDGTAIDGTYELTNDGGTWFGEWSGEITADGSHIIDGLYIGSGDYEGLQYRQHVEGLDYPFTLTGTIEAIP